MKLKGGTSIGQTLQTHPSENVSKENPSEEKSNESTNEGDQGNDENSSNAAHPLSDIAVKKSQESDNDSE
jgi:hypothetical protein